MSTLIKKLFIYSLGNFSVLIINFFLVPFYTFYLSKSELGYYDIVVTTATLLIPLVTLQIDVALLRWVIDEKSNERKFRYIQNSLIIVLSLIFIFTIIYVIYNFIIDVNYSLIIYLYFILLFLYPFFKQMLRSLGFTKLYVIIEFSNTTIFLICAVISVLNLKLGVKGLIISNAISLFLVEIFVFNKIKLYQYFKNIYFDINISKQILNYSLPLVVNALSIWFFSYSLKYIILFNNGYEANGLFAVAMKFASIIQIINSIFYLAWQEEAFIKFNQIGREKFFQNVLNIYISILFLLLLFITSFQIYIVPIIIDLEYKDAIKYIPILSLGYVFISLAYFYGVFFQCSKQTKHISISSIIASSCIIFIALFYFKKYDLYVASVSFLISTILLFVYRIYKVKKIINLDLPLKKIFVYLFIFLILFKLSFEIKLKFIIIINVLLLIFFIIIHFNFIITNIKTLRKKINIINN